MAYQQLTQAQRYQIFAFCEAGLSLRDKAKKHISGELRRNKQPDMPYDPCYAQHLNDQLRRKAFKVTKR